MLRAGLLLACLGIALPTEGVRADGSSVNLLSTGGLLSQPYFVTLVPPGPPPPAVPLGSPGVWLLLVLVLATTGAHRLRGARRATG